MPENYSLNKNVTLDWFVRRCDWPLEKIILDVHVITSRTPHPLEWLVIRLLEESLDPPPTIEEATRELGLADPGFLADTVQSLINQGAVARKDSAAATDLPNLTLTERGKSLLRDDSLAGLSNLHGITLHVDAITGEHHAKVPRTIKANPEFPIIAVEKLPPRIESIGVDRLRELAKVQGEACLKGGSMIQNATVRVSEGGYVWRPVRIRYRIDPEGTLSAVLDRGTDAQQAWLDRLDLNIPSLGLGVLAWSAREVNLAQGPPVEVTPFTEWFGRTDRLIDPNTVLNEVQTLIDSVRTELVFHADWFHVRRLQEALLKKRENSIQFYLCREEDTEFSDPELDNTRLIVHPAESGLPQAIIADRHQALVLDAIKVTTPAGGTRVIEAASWVRTQAIPAFRRRLLGQAAEPDPESNF
jgi:hypothetical protein